MVMIHAKLSEHEKSLFIKIFLTSFSYTYMASFIPSSYLHKRHIKENL